MASWPAVAQERVRRNVEIEWEVVGGASEYEVEFVRKDEKGAKPTRFKTKKASWEANIKPGLYLVKIRSLDQRGVPGEWPEPMELAVKLPAIIPAAGGSSEALVRATDPDKHDLKLSWEPIPGAQKYLVNVRSTTTEWSAQKEVRDPSWSVNVPSGQVYEWNAVAIDERGGQGERLDSSFKVTVQAPGLELPQVEKPLSRFVREVKWTPSPHVTHYSYVLKRIDRKQRKWVIVDKKEEYKEETVPLKFSTPTGKYRLELQAHGKLRDSSQKSILDFEVEGGFRDPASFDRAELKDSISKPTNFYAIASYLITQVQYSANNYDRNSIPSFKALGGTGRIGLGYQTPNSRWGGFAIVDLSGFTIGSKNYTFSSIEAHATRKLDLGQRGLWLIGAGIFSKELPIVLGSETVGYQGLGKVRTIGPHAGFNYWLPFNQRLGLQLNARGYYGFFGSSDSGQQVQPTLSFQYGLLGSYRLSPTMMGYAGYAHRTDQANYESNPSDPTSFARPGEVNSIRIDGDYLNLIFEYSF